jgi:hypothetical protein
MVAPRLAGQRFLYLETQIKSFREHVRDNPCAPKPGPNHVFKETIFSPFCSRF